MNFEQKFEGLEELDSGMSGGRAFQSEGTASANVLRWKTDHVVCDCSQGSCVAGAGHVRSLVSVGQRSR